MTDLKIKPKAPPEDFRLKAEIRFEEEPPEAEVKGHRFTLFAHSGTPMAAGWGNVAVDLQGIKWGARAIPILHNHQEGRRVGWSEKIELDEKHGLVIQGKFLLKGAIAREIREDAAEGYPWQASVYLKSRRIEEVAAGAVAEVNGHKMPGPGYVIRESYLREGSFCELGADENTGAELLSAERLSAMAGEKPGGAAEDPTKAAVAQERARVATILKAAYMPRQAELAAKLAEDGAEVADALLALIEDLKATTSAMEAKVNELVEEDEGDDDEGDDDEAPPGDESMAEPESEDAGKQEIRKRLAQLRGKPVGAGKPPEAKKAFATLKEEWDASPELQKEFVSFEGFQAFREAEAKGKVAIFQGRN